MCSNCEKFAMAALDAIQPKAQKAYELQVSAVDTRARTPEPLKNDTWYPNSNNAPLSAALVLTLAIPWFNLSMDCCSHCQYEYGGQA